MSGENSPRLVGAPVFQPLPHPELKAIGQENVRAFIEARNRYRAAIEERNTEPGVKITPVSVKASIDADLLTSICELEILGPQVTIENVTSVNIQSWLDKFTINSKDHASISQIEELVGKHVRLDLKEPNATQRVTKLFATYTTLLRRNGFGWLIKENTELAVKHIIGMLRPLELQNRIKDDLDLGHAHLKKTWVPFYEHVRDQAVVCDKFCGPSRTSKVAPPLSGKNLGFGDSGGYHPKHAKQSSPTNINSPKRQVVDSAGTSAGTARNSANTPDCLNPSCHEKHFLKNCPNTGPELKKQLYDALAQRRKADGEQRETRGNANKDPSIGTLSRAAMKLAKVQKPAFLSEGRLRAQLHDTIDITTMPDIGADDNVLPRSLVNELSNRGIFVPLLFLEEPVLFDLAVDTTGLMSVQSNIKARLSVTLNLPAGPLRLRNVNWLVVDHEMPEVLLGRPLLKALGLDADSHLSNVRELHHDSDFSHVEVTGGNSKISRMLSRLDTNVHAEDECLSYGDIADLGPKHDRCQNHQKSIAHFAFSETEGVKHGDLDEDPIPEDPHLDLGRDTPSEIRAAFFAMIQTASVNGMSPSGVKTLSDLLTEYEDIWRIKLGPDPPANLPPMEITITPGSFPVRVKPRRYPPQQKLFIEKHCAKLVEYGLAYANTTSPWACAPLAVSKPGGRFRFTVDLRPVNAVTQPATWPMPHLESALDQVALSKVFGTFDLCQGYWQLPLATESQSTQSFITHEGVFTPTRVLQGSTNAVAHFQSSIQMIIRPLGIQMLQWLDDMLAHAPTETALLSLYRDFFSICRTYGLKLHALKCVLFALSVRWCGRMISASGIRFDPSRLEGLKDLALPITASDLQQFTCSLNWMRTSIPNFSALIAPLITTLEEAYALAGSRTKRAVSKILLSQTGWGEAQLKAFQLAKENLSKAVTLAHPSKDKRICVFTDASDRHWASIITQVPPEDLSLPICDQRHEPLSFLSGSFNGAPSRWPTVEKEAFAIVATCTRLDYLLMRPDGFSLFTDHRNLIYIFNPRGCNSGLSSHTASKLLRWALKLCSFNYTIEHISGDDNCWADLLSRWGAPNLLSARSSMRILAIAKNAPNTNDRVSWPASADIKCSQLNAINSGEQPSEPTKSKNGILFKAHGAAWVPNSDLALQLRLIVIAHTGRGGHRARATAENILPYFSWDSLRSDVSLFVKGCLHCLSTTGGSREPRPLGEAIHATRPNEVIHFDFLYLGPSSSEMKYVLVIKDDLSGYVWLVPSSKADANTTTEALIQWFSNFGIAGVWVSDQGSHFKNVVLENVSHALRVKHHFTVAYSPWANGTVEVVNREILRVTRALLSELRIQKNEWPSIMPLVQSILNHSSSDRLNGIAPITAFTGLPADSPLASIFKQHTGELMNLETIKIAQNDCIQSLVNSLEKMHKACVVAASSRRQRKRYSQSRKATARRPNFSIGDFVLVGHTTKHATDKLSLVWRGPRRIVRIESEHVYDVEDLLTGHVVAVHATRLKFYHDKSLNITEDFEEQIAHNQDGWHVSSIRDLRVNQSTLEIEVLVAWRGFPAEEATWEPIQTVHEDIPDVLSRFLQKHQNHELVRKASEFISRT
jgi:RNase H-like domain found in reverse transcriptase/Integrase core domain/Reverse transcriptase (RNA-dependent DNA polymerase)/Chromo (CHRromatin Organisation MOdifier) domain